MLSDQEMNVDQVYPTEVYPEILQKIVPAALVSRLVLYLPVQQNCEHSICHSSRS